MPPEFAENIEQLVENALRFDSYRTYGPGSGQREFWERKMKSGRSFLHLTSLNGDIFCPSMFAGYRGNSLEMSTSAAQEMDGRRTNNKINELLGSNRANENSRIALQSVFERYNLLGGWPRPWFWVLNEGENGTYVSITNDGNGNAIGQPPAAALEHSLNRIFYGPPGTGKTYHTVNAALAILDPDFDDSKNRSELVQRFEELKNEGRIEFVTFHQSFSYEEFVEGLKATTDSNGQIAYEVHGGIFKRLCLKALSGKDTLTIEQAVEDMKIKCLEGSVSVEIASGTKEVRFVGKSFQLQSDQMQAPYSISVDRIVKNWSTYQESNESTQAGNLKTMLEYISANYQIHDSKMTDYSKAHVLIIDEINRGNISRIFGELITLIEPSKRAGAEDALSVTLPYSGESFSVPKNLYIIGTMNTADRSIALLDTALRRRFHFEEMMPELTLLDGVTVEGVEIQKLLSSMNNRIEALYDRDHQIGHTYFLPLKKDPSLARLSDIFLHSVLPLLQEYFYEDWEKIDMVLGENGFLGHSDPPGELNLDNAKKLWRIQRDAFSSAENYRKIYSG